MHHLERFSFLKPILGLVNDILELETVGQISRDVLHFLQGSLECFHAVMRPDVKRHEDKYTVYVSLHSDMSASKPFFPQLSISVHLKKEHLLTKLYNISPGMY